jgi:hypothetical protein
MIASRSVERVMQVFRPHLRSRGGSPVTLEKLVGGLVLAALTILAPTSKVQAFHSGGVAECNGCHTMHGSVPELVDDGETGQVLGPPYYQAGPYLLKASDQSSACLNCHSGPTLSGYHVLTFPLPAAGAAPVNFTPGGDFAWLQKSYVWEVRTRTFQDDKGERKGHNVVAADFGLLADTTLTVAPGGTYPRESLHCSSCHDPHGKYRVLEDGSIVDGKTTSKPIIGSGSYQTSKTPTTWGAVGAYRILAGAGYEPKSTTGYPFANTVPVAVARATYNVVESDTVINRVAYGTGMSEWCANCHAGIHLNEAYVSGQPGLRHPAGNDAKLPDFVIANYGSYVKSGDLSGALATSYNTLTPFEEGTSDLAALKALQATVSNKAGPVAGSANVSCMTCHRAHATGFEAMLRFPLSADYMTAADAAGAPTYGDPAAAPGTDNVKVANGRTNAEMMAALYGRTPASFAPFQRALCNKCHVKD